MLGFLDPGNVLWCVGSCRWYERTPLGKAMSQESTHSKSSVASRCIQPLDQAEPCLLTSALMQGADSGRLMRLDLGGHSNKQTWSLGTGEKLFWRIPGDQFCSQEFRMSKTDHYTVKYFILTLYVTCTYDRFITVNYSKRNYKNTTESAQLLLSLYMCHIAYAVVILQTVLWLRQWCQWYANDSVHLRSFAFNLSSQLATPCCDEELSTSHCAMLAWTSCRPESSIEHQNGCWPTCSALIPAPCEELFAHDLDSSFLNQNLLYQFIEKNKCLVDVFQTAESTKFTKSRTEAACEQAKANTTSLLHIHLVELFL